jgi:DNA polymerase-4
VPDSSPLRRILHCDMDAFYAAVHMRDDPSLRGRPVVVGGDPASRGVVAAASYEARAFGIHSAMPAARAIRLCPEAVFLRPDFRSYVAESAKIIAIFRDYSPVVQPMSLDEAYVDVTDRLGSFTSATELAVDIRGRVREELRLTVSVGVAPNKLVAKIASDHRKPDGLTVVPPRRVMSFLAPLPVRRLHGIGPSSERALHAMGIATVAELRELSVDQLMARFGSWGRTLFQYARGIDDRPVRTDQVRKSLGTERTFPQDVADPHAIDDILGEMATEVASGLEHRRLAAGTITVKVRYPDFATHTRSMSLPVPTPAAPVIASCARLLVRRTDATARAVRLLGVSASGLISCDHEQLALFEPTAESGQVTSSK